MEYDHEPKSYGKQFAEDFTWHGFRHNSIGPIIPSSHDCKEQGKIVYNVLVKGPYFIGKFLFTKHD